MVNIVPIRLTHRTPTGSDFWWRTTSYLGIKTETRFAQNAARLFLAPREACGAVSTGPMGSTRRLRSAQAHG